jgi:hypothetical protein
VPSDSYASNKRCSVAVPKTNSHSSRRGPDHPVVDLYLCLYLFRASEGAPSNGNQSASVLYDVEASLH